MQNFILYYKISPHSSVQTDTVRARNKRHAFEMFSKEQAKGIVKMNNIKTEPSTYEETMKQYSSVRMRLERL